MMALRKSHDPMLTGDPIYIIFIKKSTIQIMAASHFVSPPISPLCVYVYACCVCIYFCLYFYHQERILG